MLFVCNIEMTSVLWSTHTYRPIAYISPSQHHQSYRCRPETHLCVVRVVDVDASLAVVAGGTETSDVGGALYTTVIAAITVSALLHLKVSDDR